MRKLLRKILKGASLTTALFIFEACYGSYDGYMHSRTYNFTVVSKEDNTPVDGVYVCSRPYKSEFLDWGRYGTTDEAGSIKVDVEVMDEMAPEFRFEDMNGIYEPKDTVIIRRDGEIVVKLSKKAE